MDKKAFGSNMTEAESKALVANLTGGGIALGVGTGIGSSLLKYLGHLRREQLRRDEDRLDDNTLYVNSSGATKEASLMAPGLGVAGGAVGFAGSHAIVHAIANRLLRKRLERELDEAQGATLGVLDKEEEAQSKQAQARTIENTGEALGAGAVAIPLLALLASAGLTYHGLNKSFPVVKSPKTKGPKHVRFAPVEGEEDTVKEAAEDSAAFDDFEAAGVEYLMKTAASVLPNSISGKIIHAASQGMTADLEKAAQENGLDGVVFALENAEHSDTSEMARCLGAMRVCKSATLTPIVELLAASEIVEALPNAYESIAGNSCPGTMTKLAHVGSILGLQSRSVAHLCNPPAEELEKSASALHPTVKYAAALDTLLGALSDGVIDPEGSAVPVEGEDDEEEDISSDVGGAPTEVEGAGDEVDDLLAGSHPNDKADILDSEEESEDIT